MSFLYLLEKIRNPFFDALFSAITLLGDETVFLVLAITVMWCVSKREGYYVLSVGLFGLVLNQTMKLVFAVPRPWVRDPSFTIVESARAAATGYSFPSGHSQNATGTFGAIAVFTKKNSVRIAAALACALVLFSRMYLGVHTPADVLFSLFAGAFLLVALRPLFTTEERFERFMPFVLGAGCILAALMAIWIGTLDPSLHDADNLRHAKETAATLLGCLVGLVTVYTLDRTVLKFNTGAAWYAQIAKLVLGFALVMLIKSGLKAPLGFIFENELIARGVRYFLVVGFAGGIWPLTFGFFSRLHIARLDSFGERVRSLFKKKS